MKWDSEGMRELSRFLSARKMKMEGGEDERERERRERERELCPTCMDTQVIDNYTTYGVFSLCSIHLLIYCVNPHMPEHKIIKTLSHTHTYYYPFTYMYVKFNWYFGAL